MSCASALRDVARWGIALLSLLASAHGTARAVDPVWIESEPTQCSLLCRRYNLLPVTTGRHSDGGSYYVCALDMGGEGWRTGYQLSTVAEYDCVVGYDGREVTSKSREHRSDRDDDDAGTDEDDAREHMRCLCY